LNIASAGANGPLVRREADASDGLRPAALADIELLDQSNQRTSKTSGLLCSFI
jgi:hypothetical protein